MGGFVGFPWRVSSDLIGLRVWDFWGGLGLKWLKVLGLGSGRQVLGFRVYQV